MSFVPAERARANAMFVPLGILPEAVLPTSDATAVSADGSVVVGRSGFEPFRWTREGGMVRLLSSFRLLDNAHALSADGSVIVGIRSAQAFRWTAEEGPVDLGFLPGGNSSAAGGVSADGTVVVGRSATIDGHEAFRWTATAGMVGLGELPGGGIRSGATAISADGAVIVGSSASDLGDEAFRWTIETGMVSLGDLPGGFPSFDSSASAVSADGSVVVGSGRSAVGTEAFRWTQEGGMVGIGHLGSAVNSRAIATSADGSVVVGDAYDAAGTESAAFIWDPILGMRSLQEELIGVYGLPLSDWQLTGAKGISADGLTIVGTGLNPDGRAESWLVVLPEPGTWMLLAAGLAALAVRGDREAV